MLNAVINEVPATKIAGNVPIYPPKPLNEEELYGR
jgi:hypothetical protein